MKAEQADGPLCIIPALRLICLSFLITADAIQTRTSNDPVPPKHVSIKFPFRFLLYRYLQRWTRSACGFGHLLFTFYVFNTTSCLSHKSPPPTPLLNVCFYFTDFMSLPPMSCLEYKNWWYTFFYLLPQLLDLIWLCFCWWPVEGIFWVHQQNIDIICSMLKITIRKKWTCERKCWQKCTYWLCLLPNILTS